MGTIVRSTPEWEAELGQQIRSTRKQQHLTQQELADRSNVSRSAIKYLEAGHGSRLATLLNVSRALGLDESLERVFATVSTVSPLALLEASRKSGR
jgi:transcriptional regulator with XRE-family HTH domain